MDNTTDAPVLGKKGTFPATVAKVIDPYKLVINKGSENGIREGQRMLVYGISDEDIKDPHTGESLGYLELVRGTEKITSIEEKMSILESDKMFELERLKRELLERLKMEELEKIQSYNAGFVKELDMEELEKIRSYRELLEKLSERKLVPFDNPEVGDMVKPI